MLSSLRKLFQTKKCAICGQKPKNGRPYYNDQGEEVLVCQKCVPYAERRAMRRV